MEKLFKAKIVKWKFIIIFLEQFTTKLAKFN